MTNVNDYVLKKDNVKVIETGNGITMVVYRAYGER